MTSEEYSSPKVTSWFESDECSIAVIELDGINRPAINHDSDTEYTVIDGEVVFAVNGVKHLLQAGESIPVLKGSRYQDMGKKTIMLAVSVPPFNPDSVEILNA